MSNNEGVYFYFHSEYRGTVFHVKIGEKISKERLAELDYHKEFSSMKFSENADKKKITVKVR